MIHCNKVYVLFSFNYFKQVQNFRYKFTKCLQHCQQMLKAGSKEPASCHRRQIPFLFFFHELCAVNGATPPRAVRQNVHAKFGAVSAGQQHLDFFETHGGALLQNFLDHIVIFHRRQGASTIDNRSTRFQRINCRSKERRNDFSEC